MEGAPSGQRGAATSHPMGNSFSFVFGSIWPRSGPHLRGGSGRCSGCVAFAARQLGNSRSLEAPFSPAPHCNIDKGSANEISRPLLANGGGGILKTQ